MLISTLASIAADAIAQGLIIGIPMSRVKKLQERNWTTQQINSTAMAILNKIKEQSSTLYNEAVNKLSSIPVYNLTGELKSYVSSAKRKLSDRINTINNLSNNIDKAIVDTTNKINEYDVIPDKHKLKAEGEKKRKEITTSVSDIAKKAEKIISDLE